jgi:diadenosine tetraphosphate (Ap4A) HIT family hydrolase
MIEEVYKATSLNIAIQNGPDAGQPVPHLHVYIIPDAKVTSAIEVEVTLFTK